VSSEGASGCGRLYGVGVGPGDPELLTLKAVRILQTVPVICVPQAEFSSDSYALTIAKDFLDLSRQEVLRLPFPTAGREASQVWREAAETIALHLQQGQDVAFIAEGDPMLYSTFSYVYQNIREMHPHLPVEIIPGISSVMAAAAKAGVPLATRSQRLAILPAMYGTDDLEQVMAEYDTVVLMKVNRKTLQALSRLGEIAPEGKAVYVRRVTTPQEQVVHDLRQLSPNDLEYFSLVIITK